jgi:hypothetical protein
MDPSFDIRTFYKTHTGRRIDTKTLAYWTGVIDKNVEKGIEDFRQFVKTSPDYTNYLLSNFRMHFLERIGRDADQTDIQNAIEVGDKRLMNEHEVLTYVCSLPFYASRCKDIIKSTLMSKNIMISDELFDKFANKMIADPSYEIDQVLQELLNPVQSASNAIDSNVAVDIVKSTEDEQDKSFLAFPTTVPTWVYDFEKQFNRPITITEFIKYHPTTVSNKSTDWVKGLYDVHVSAFKQISELYNLYLSTPLSEHDFIERFIDRLTTNDLKNIELERILNSNEYTTSLCNALQTTYQTLYDKNMDSLALTYSFQKAKTEKMGLKDERLHSFIVQLKKEEESFCDRIHSKFLDVYQRDPDNEEVQQWIPVYRNNDCNVADDLLVKELISGLEFHDVLKRKIRRRHIELHENEIPTGTLYKVLCCCLDNIPKTPSSFVNIDDLITKQVV